MNVSEDANVDHLRTKSRYDCFPLVYVWQEPRAREGEPRDMQRRSLYSVCTNGQLVGLKAEGEYKQMGNR